MAPHVLSRSALVLIALSLSGSFALAARPAAGHGGVFADGITSVHFDWTDFDSDFFQVLWPRGSSNDFARATPDGQYYVHAGESDVEMFAVVGGVPYAGRGDYRNAFFADCTVFDLLAPAFDCSIGPGSATMDARGSVTNQLTGEACTLTAHLAAFFVKEKACVAIGFPPPDCVGGSLIVANAKQFSIAVQCGE